MRSYWKYNLTAGIEARNCLIFVLLLLLSVACSSNKDQHVHAAEEYTCPMHPQVIQDKPGNCPVCGMDLVKKSRGGTDVAISNDLKNLIKPTNASVVASIETIRPERKTMSVNVKAPGVISYDTRKTFSVPVRFGGRIERLFLKYNYQPVHAGEVIMEIYSPEIVTVQRELLYVISEHKTEAGIIEGVKQKLILLGLTDVQIESIVKVRKETFALPVLSPYTGYIVESTVSVPENPVVSSSSTAMSSGGMDKKSSGGMSGGMPANNAMDFNPSAVPGGQLSIREGMYVTTGQSLFKVVDGTRLWAELYFSAADGALIKKGVAIQLHINGAAKPLNAKVDFIQPFFSEGKQFMQVRSYINVNSGDIRVGQLLTAHVTQVKEQQLWVPRKAVLDLGVQQIVFIKEGKTFKPFQVKTGLESGDWIEVTDGLKDSEEIAANAQYLVDSESFIKVSKK